MKLLLENWRRYLNEISRLETAEENLDNKTLKIIKAYRYDRERESEAIGQAYSGSQVDTLHRNFKNYLIDSVPMDLTDNERGTTILWLIKLARENPKVAAAFIHGTIFAQNRHSLEIFFHNQRFMPEQDLMRVKSMTDLANMTRAAQEEIQKAQEKKNYLDAPSGTEILRDDNEWTIAALHNKGAACSLGKGTDWCTAAPGLNYFEDYYRKDDPLFYFLKRETPEEFEAKYQFHYGSSQFMDANDNQVDKETFEMLHGKLIETDAWDKYEKLKIFDLKRMVKIRLVDGSPGMVALIDEMREILNSLENPHSMANTLAEMATMDHFNIPTYILRWLASEEFYKYSGVARRIVKYHDVVPSSILEDLAENNPNLRTRVMAREVLDKRRGDYDIGNLARRKLKQGDLNETTT